MKKNKTYMWLMSAAVTFTCALGLASCDRDNDIDLSNAMRIVTERGNGGSKTYIDGNKTYWVNGDDVIVNGNEKSVTVSDGEYYILDVNNSTDMYAVSPESAYEEGISTVTMSFGASYAYQEYSGHQRIALRMVGYAPAGATEMKFMHVGGMVAVTVNNSNTSLPLWLEKITVTSDKYKLRGTVEVEIPATEGEAPTVEPVAKGASDNYVSLSFRGSETVAASGSKTYYIPCLPTGDDNHFTIKVEGFYYYPEGNTTGLLDDNYIHSTFEKTSTSTKALERGHIAPATVALHSTIGTSANCTAAKVYHPFTYASGKACYFSKGNLYFQGSTKSYTFADNQYDYIGAADGNNATSGRATNTAYIDLYGYGTGGNLDAKPYIVSKSNSDYPDKALTSSDYEGGDWGRAASYNSVGSNYSFVSTISHTVNKYSDNATWRVFRGGTQATSNEWYYILRSRSDTKRFTLAQVNGVNGLLIFPDGFTDPQGITWGTINGSTTQTVVNLDYWRRLEANGCVFLPCAGQRVLNASSSSVTTVTNVNSNGYYWTSSNGYWITFGTSSINVNVSSGLGGSSSKYYGCAVRVVRQSHP